MNDSWALSQVWNECLDTNRQRELQPRDYLWASELGKSYYDRYWRMKGRAATTPPNARATRKFEAGNLTEWVVMQILRRAQVLQETQTVVENADGPIKVRGRCDFIAGGEVSAVDLSDLPETLGIISEAVLQRLKERFPEGLATQGLELKSCSVFMFNKYERAPAIQHALQAFHYAHKLDIPFHIVYLCRDDLRMVEWVIRPDAKLWKQAYDADLQEMARVVAMSEDEISSQLEPLLVWNGNDQKFEKNWKVEYSDYLTDYGFDRPDQYAEGAKVVSRLNNVIKAIKFGKPLTKKNLEAIEIGSKFYPPVVEQIEAFKKKAKYMEETK